jgi:hypothetical protein
LLAATEAAWYAGNRKIAGAALTEVVNLAKMPSSHPCPSEVANMPKPVLQAMVLADHVYQDRTTGKHIIAGTFTGLFFGSSKVQQADNESDRQDVTGPITRIGSPCLYIALVEVHGQVPLDLKYIDLSDSSVLFEAQVVVAANDPVAVAEYIIPMPMLPARQAGNYSLDLLHDGEILGSWRVSVRKIPDKTDETGVEQ